MQNLFAVVRKTKRKEKWIGGYQSSKRTLLRQLERCVLSVTGAENLLTLSEGCVSKECALFTFRLGSNPYRKTMSDARREKARKTMKVTMAELN